MALVCSQAHTTFVLLSAVFLNLPATVFTPQGDHVIRSHPLAHLSSCSTARPEKQLKKENNINWQDPTTSNAHCILAQSFLYDHYSFRNPTRLISFFFHPTFERLTKLHHSFLSTLTYDFISRRTRCTAAQCAQYPLPAHLHFSKKVLPVSHL